MPKMDELTHINEIINKKTKTFVHCRSGIHNTNIICGASSILRGKKTLNEAIENIIQSNFFHTRKKTANKNNKHDTRIRKLNKLITRLSQFVEMFQQQTKV